MFWNACIRVADARNAHIIVFYTNVTVIKNVFILPNYIWHVCTKSIDAMISKSVEIRSFQVNNFHVRATNNVWIAADIWIHHVKNIDIIYVNTLKSLKMHLQFFQILKVEKLKLRIKIEINWKFLRLFLILYWSIFIEVIPQARNPELISWKIYYFLFNQHFVLYEYEDLYVN